MLEKIGLPAKPSAKGKTWVIDASSCQTCQGAFTMFNRKHHCRRCGGIFCGNCTSQRAVLRGQGDAPVRICDPCKKLEEAARFQLRNRGKKGAKAASAAEDDSLLMEVLGGDVHALLSGRHEPGDDEIDDHHSNSAVSKSAHSSKNSSAHVSPSKDGREEHHEESQFTPEELRNQAIEQKTLYTGLKKEGKHVEALQAYKRFKELGREADALELSLKKIQRKATLEASQKLKESPESAKDKGLEGTSDAKGKDLSQDLKRGRLSSRDSGDDDLLKTLKDLGWDDADLVEKKPKKGPSSDLDLLAEISDVLPKEASSKKPATENPTQLEILAHKRKALALKREGKPTEAKEELKKAKLLEKKLEEMAIFGDEDEEDDDADDDDLAKLMRSLEKEAKLDLGKGKSGQVPVDFSVPSFLADDDDAHVDVTDDDIHDPSMVAALREMGWEEEAAAIQRSRAPSTSGPEALHIAASVATESQLQSEILTHKRQALALKREGKITEAKVKLQEAKTLEQQLEVLRRQPPVPTVRAPGKIKGATQMKLEDILEDQDDPVQVDEEDEKDPEILAALKAMGYVEDETAPPVQTYVKPSPQEKNKLQDEILAVKRSALALKKGGRIAEAKEELRQAKVLEQRLEKLTAELEADGLPKPITIGSKFGKPTQLPALPLSQMGFVSADEEEEVEVSAEDFMDPELVAALKSVGWQEEDTFVKDKEPEKVEEPDSPPAPVQPYKPVKYTAKDHQRKLQLQKDLLSHKRRALTLKREGKVEEAKAELKQAKLVEKEMEEIENAATGSVESVDEKLLQKSRNNTTSLPAAIAYEYEEHEEVTDADMQDPEMLETLKGFGWKAEPDAKVVNNSSKSSSSALPALARLDNNVSLKTVLDSGRMPEATPKEVGRFDTSRGGSRKYENPPYVKEPTVDAVPDPIWQSILNSSSRKLNECNESGKSDSHVKELQRGTSFRTNIGLPVNATAPFFDHPTSDTSGNRKSSRQGSLDLLSGETWSSPTKEVPVESDSDEDEDLFDPDMLAALQSIGMAPPSMKTGKRPQAESSVAKQPISRVSVKDEFPAPPAKDDRRETVGNSSPMFEAKVESVASGSPSLSRPTVISEARAETTAPTAVPAPPKAETSDLQDEIKMRKRKAVAFKREGKLSEAREELKQAKLLEKQLETQASVPDDNFKSVSAPVPQNQPPQRIHYETPPPPPAAPVVSQTHKQQMQQQVRQGKDRMKLQRESLAHKRKALGLRREGKLEEAEAEFELAKTLEKQMEDLDPSKPAHDEGDMGLVEDLLDPQLMAALKGIGWNDGDLTGGNLTKPASVSRITQPSNSEMSTSRQASSTLSSANEGRANISNQPPARRGPVSSTSSNAFEDRSASISQPPARRAPQATTTAAPAQIQDTRRVNEGVSARPSASRVQEERRPSASVGAPKSSSTKAQEERKKLEDRIKQEKVRAVELKRAGRTGEALDVLRGAKQMEKQLQSMP
ncbi:hypothetical protein Mapa_006701 [Marchantia paleacea]|nr:hypothetical protein Mapa_006701 [Marchantia paleacea]